MLRERIGEGKPFPNRKRMADALGIDPSQLNRFIDGERGLSSDTLGRLLDGLGARLAWPGETEGGSAREVCFVAPRMAAGEGGAPAPQAEDYNAVPLVSEQAVATPGRIPEEAITGWLLIWRHHESVRFRSELMAVTLDKGELALAPALHPGDTVLVDRREKSPEPPGKIMLVRGPGGGARVMRVASRAVEGDTELVFYSDNGRDYPPQVYRLQRDFGGDIDRAIAGRVVWAWSDMARK